MSKPITDKPRRDIVKRCARSFMLASGQKKLPIDIDDLFTKNGCLIMEAESAEKTTGMKIPIEFWDNETVDAFTCYRAASYVTLFKSKGKSIQRVRFTKAHELGHIALKHFEEFEQPDSFSIYRSQQYKVLEREADMFAAELLAPTPVLSEININKPADIQRICDISGTAADIAVSDLKMNIDVTEMDRNNVLRRFHKYIFTKEYLSRIPEPICAVCGGSRKDSNLMCCNCGTNNLGTKIGYTIRMRQPVLTHNGRLRYCYRCGNTTFKGGQKECEECGQPLYNKCIDLEHKRLLSGNARFCPICGKVTSFYQTGILNDWEEDRSIICEEDRYFERFIDGIPLSEDWHYFVHKILVDVDIKLYIKLRNTVAIIDGDDLIIFGDVDDIPIDFIRDSMKKYCELEIISVSIENGGYEYDI